MRPLGRFMNYDETFEASYKRILTKRNNEDFVEYFYKILVGRNDTIKKIFANIDLERQRRMVKKSIFYIYNCYRDKYINDDLEKIAVLHNKHNLNIPTHLYDVWLDCLLESVEKFDPEYNDEIEVAWRMIMSVGISYMKFQYDKAADRVYS